MGGKLDSNVPNEIMAICFNDLGPHLGPDNNTEAWGSGIVYSPSETH